MVFEFRLPDVGEGVAEGEVVKWLVKEGAEVGENQPLVEIMTDKVNVEIPSPKKGTVLKLMAKEGEVVKVGQVLLVIGEKGEQQPQKRLSRQLPRLHLFLLSRNCSQPHRWHRPSSRRNRRRSWLHQPLANWPEILASISH